MMAYLGLTDAEDAILQDNVHTLTCFKPGKGVDSKKEPSFYIPCKMPIVPLCTDLRFSQKQNYCETRNDQNQDTIDLQSDLAEW
jgi:hypothetical protein